MVYFLLSFFKESGNVEIETWKKPCEYRECWFLSQVFCCNSIGRQKISLNVRNILMLKGTLLNLMP